MISLIMPTYNCANHLSTALETLTNQDFQEIVNIVVVDDGSTDHTDEILREYEDSGMIDYLQQPHQNANVARNEGFKYASYYWGDEYTMFIDSDCEYADVYIRSLYDAIEKEPEAPFVYCDFTVNDTVKNKKRYHRSGEFSLPRLQENNYIDTSAAIIRSNYVVDFDNDLYRLQDWDFFLTIVEASVFEPVYLPMTLYTNIVREKSTSYSQSYSKSREYVINKHDL